MNAEKKVCKMSLAQKQKLSEFINSNDDLRCGKFTKDFTYKKGQELWIEISQTLNGMVGARKDWKQWRKSWQDLVTKTKAKKSMIHRHMQGSGGGPPIEIQLDPLDEEILGTIPAAAMYGHENVVEPEVIFEFENAAEPLQVQERQLQVKEKLQVDVQPQHLFEVVAPTTSPKAAVAPPGKENLKVGKKSFVKGRRLENTISATKNLATLTERKINIKERYYKRKLELLERKVNIKERHAVAQEETVAVLKDLNNNFENFILNL